MSGLDGLQLDPDGYVDMDQFPDDGTDLGEVDLAQLRQALHSDPVDEPTDAEWEAMYDEVVASDDGGPFALDDGGSVFADDGDGDLFGAEAGDAAADLSDDDTSSDDTDADVDAEALATDGVDPDGDAGDVAGLGDDGLGGDDIDVSTDLDLDAELDLDLDAGLDLTTDDGFADDVVDDVPATVDGTDFEDLL